MLCRVIYPEDYEHENIKCSCCGLFYTNKDYKTLKEANRLAYFSSHDYGIFCHICLMEYMRTNKDSQEEDPILIITKKGQIKLQ